MKALSLTQPWATLVIIGAKKIETRSWYTGHRGTIYLHAAKGFPRWAQSYTRHRAFQEALKDEPLPIGAILGTVEVLDCVRITPENTPPTPEVHFGDYTPGRYAWKLGKVVRFEKPIPWKGALGLFEVAGNEGVQG